MWQGDVLPPAQSMKLMVSKTLDLDSRERERKKERELEDFVVPCV